MPLLNYRIAHSKSYASVISNLWLHKYISSSPSHSHPSSCRCRATKMRKPAKSTGKASSAAIKPSPKSDRVVKSAFVVKPSSNKVGGVKTCRNCRNETAPCLCRGSMNFGLCCNCLDYENRELRTCVNGCLSIDMTTDSDSSYEVCS